MKPRRSAKFWLLMTVTTLVGGSVLVGTQYSRVSAEQKRVEALRSDTQDEIEVQDNLLASEKSLRDSKEKLTHLEQGIPTAAYVPTMLSELEKAGKLNGIKVIGVRPVPKVALRPAAAAAEAEAGAVARPAYDELDIEVKGRGTYGSVMKFVKALEAFPKIVAARTISIVPSTDPISKDLGELDVTVELRSYLFKDEEKEEDKTKEVASA